MILHKKYTFDSDQNKQQKRMEVFWEVRCFYFY